MEVYALARVVAIILRTVFADKEVSLDGIGVAVNLIIPLNLCN